VSALAPDAASSDRLRRALDGAECGIWDWELQTGTLVWDKRIAELHGIDPEQFDGRLESFFERVHPDDLPALQSAIAEAVSTGSRFLEEFRVVLPTGHTRWVQGRGQAVRGSSGQTERMVGIGMDTTRLRTVRERAGRALEHVRDGILILSPDWHIDFVNAAAGTLLRREPQQLLGKILWDEFPESIGDVVDRQYRRASETGESVFFEVYYGPVDGWFEVTAFPAPDGLTVTFRDINARRAADDERTRLVSDLHSALIRNSRQLALSQVLSEALSLDQVDRAVAASAADALGTRFAGIALLDEDHRNLRFVSLEGLPQPVDQQWREVPLTVDAPLGLAVRQRRGYFHRSRQELLGEFPHLSSTILTADLHAFASVPLIASGSVLGALSMSWKHEHEISTAEREFIETLAGQCAQAVARSLLVERQQAVADAMRRAVLPEWLPTVPGVSLVSRYSAAGADVGGDWFDAFHLPNGQLGLVVGDVAGHGVKAAAVMAQLRISTRAYALAELEPGVVMTRVATLLTHIESAATATAVYVRFDPSTGSVDWSSAGHMPLLLHDPATGASYLDTPHGPLLGAPNNSPYGQSSHVVTSGSTLCLFTDGLVESRSWSLAAGLEHLRGVVSRAAADDSLDRFCDLVVASALAGREQEDDMCLLTLRRAPGPR
jgi:PAS domain S-box-containing protein